MILWTAAGLCASAAAKRSQLEVSNLVEIYKRREIIEACDPLHFNPQR